MTAPPSIAAAPRVGRRLTATPGRWSQAASTTVQWQRSRDGRAWQTLARSVAYTPGRADLRYRLRVVVTAVNVRGSTTADSAPTGPALGSPQLGPDPDVSRALERPPVGAGADDRADGRLDDHEVHQLAIDELLQR